MARTSQDPTLLQMALVGYQSEKEKIEARMQEIRALLNGKSSPVAAAENGKPRVKRILSAEARERIAAAQKKRWAAHRKAAEAGDQSGD